MSEGWSTYLDPGERILWEGQPTDRLFLLRGIDTFLIPFSIVWTGVVGAIVIGSVRGDGSLPVIPILFLCFGVWLLIGRFFHDRHMRRRTVYALSNRRAFIAQRAGGRGLRTLTLDHGLPLAFAAGPGNGRVTFGYPAPLSGLKPGLAIWLGDDGSFTFRGLADAEAVFALARSIARGEAA